ncbi:MAG TPA: MFS transporter [Candidatus Acidoferrales bacterium]|nr:MFS transporter [Candidatus Acidoferrales bacterium]
MTISPDTTAIQASRARYGVLIFALAITAISYLDRVCISMAAPFVERDLHLSDLQLGLVFSVFTFAYAAFEIPGGWLADRFGPRLMLTRVVVWWSLMTAATGLAYGFVSLLLVRLLFGVGEAGMFPGLSRAFSRWFPKNWRGNAFGLVIMSALLGGAVTQWLTAELLTRWHWRTIFFVYALAGVAWSVLWFWWFRDEPQSHHGVNQSELKIISPESARSTERERTPWKQLFRNRSLTLLCGMYFGVIYGWYFFLTWMPKYLLSARGFDLKTVGWLAMLPLLCMAAGVALAGWTSDRLVLRIGRRWGRRIPGVIGLPLAAVILVTAIETADARVSAFLFATAAGLATFGVAPAWAACLDIGGSHAGVVTGTMNTFGNLGGAVGPMLVGFYLDWGHSWNIPLLTVAFFYLFAAACWLGIRSDEPIQL